MAGRRAAVKDPQEQDGSEVAIPQQARYVNGKRVIGEEDVLSPIAARTKNPAHIFRGFRRLLLEDGSDILGCADCDHTSGRGEMMRHRNQEHGAYGGNRKKETSHIADLMQQPLSEIIDLAVAGRGWEEVYTMLSAQRDEEVEKRRAAEGKLTRLTMKLARAGLSLKEDD